jgi:hypothetical protein
MQTGDMAKYQIQDRIRAAEIDRRSREATAGRTRVRRAAVRRIGSGLLSVVAAVRPTHPIAAELQARPA